MQDVRQAPAWQTELAQAVTDPAELLRLVGLGTEWLEGANRAARLFPLRVPRGFVARIAKGDPTDPLLRQVLPLDLEELQVDGFVADPVGDLSAMAVPGVLHKYQGRVLLTTTGACAVHCRYCFRRHFPYSAANPGSGDWHQAIAFLENSPDVQEVILSGGDPLALSDRRLADLVERLAAIPHLRRLRLHTRLPIVLPERVTPELLDWLTSSRLKTVVVVHTNHASEIDPAVAHALLTLAQAGIALFNQAVLLKGVNDTADQQVALCETLFDARVLPYYLHLLDRVAGAAHFEVATEAALAIMREAAARLPGYLLPRLVREVPGAEGKTLVVTS